MRRPLALAAAALAAIGGSAVLAPRAFPGHAMAVVAPHDAQVQLVAARNSLAKQTPAGQEAAARFALQSLRAMPYNQPALTLAIATGAVDRRTEAANLSAALGWRDTLSNARIARLAMAAEAPVIAAQRVDALGRTQGGEFAAPVADKVMAMAGGPDALADRARYRTGALWWISYLRLPAESAEARAGRLEFARKLEVSEGPWRRTIIGTLLGSLTGEDAAEQRLALWRATLADPAKSGAVLYDEAFDGIDADEPSYGGEWRRLANAPVAVERGADGVAITETASRAGTVLVQRFSARPGRYRLSAGGDMRSERFSWQIACVGRPPVFASQTAIGAWDLTIPAGCSAAELRLNAGEGQAPGEVHRLERVSLEPAP